MSTLLPKVIHTNIISMCIIYSEQFVYLADKFNSAVVYECFCDCFECRTFFFFFLTKCSSPCCTDNFGLALRKKKLIKHFYKEIKLVIASVHEDVLKTLHSSYLLPINQQTHVLRVLRQVFLNNYRIQPLSFDDVTLQRESNNRPNVVTVCVYVIIFNLITALRVSYSHHQQGSNCQRSFSPISCALQYTIMFNFQPHEK